MKEHRPFDLRYLLGSCKPEKSYKDHSKSAMKHSQVTIHCSESLRFFALLVMCCTILAHISATESLKNDDAQETRQELPRSIVQRRASKENDTSHPQDIEKRLKIIEQKYVLTNLA